MSTFSQEQFDQMFAVCDLTTSQGQRDYTILSVLRATGIRVSELCNLCLQDVSDTSIRVLDSKTNQEYEAKIEPAVAEQLQLYISHYRKPAENNDPHVFVNDAGKPLSRGDVGQLFRAVKKRAGIEERGLSVHAFRHTFYTQLFRSLKQS